MPRTREDKARAIARVERDGPEPVEDLALVAGANERSLVRWIRDGRGGVYLDGINRGGRWYSSAKAVARFLSEIARGEEEGQDRDAARPLVQSGAARATRPPPSPTAGPAGR